MEGLVCNGSLRLKGFRHAPSPAVQYHPTINPTSPSPIPTTITLSTAPTDIFLLRVSTHEGEIKHISISFVIVDPECCPNTGGADQWLGIMRWVSTLVWLAQCLNTSLSVSLCLSAFGCLFLTSSSCWCCPLNPVAQCGEDGGRR